jgi:hypothetical protein
VQLKQALYRLRNLLILWYKEFSRMLCQLGLLLSKEEPCLFFNKERRIIVLFYVNNILVIYYKDNVKKGTKIITVIKLAYKVNNYRAAK